MSKKERAKKGTESIGASIAHIHLTPGDYAAMRKVLGSAKPQSRPLTATEYHEQVFSVGVEHTRLERLGWILAMPLDEDNDADERIALLMRVGNEQTLHPRTDEALRRTARQVLVRFYANETASSWRRSGDSVCALAKFFAANERHCRFTDRDRQRIQRFLEVAWRCRDKSARGDKASAVDRTIAQALIFAQHYSFLREHDIEEAIPILYDMLTPTSNSGDGSVTLEIDDGLVDHAFGDRCHGWAQDAVLKIVTLAGDNLRHSEAKSPCHESAVTLLMLTATSVKYYGVRNLENATPSYTQPRPRR